MPEHHYLPREIEEEIEEHKKAPRSREGAHPELLEEFGQETTEEPLERQDVEQEVADFIGQNLADVFSLLFSFSSQGQYLNFQKHLQCFDLTNDEIALRGGGVND